MNFNKHLNLEGQHAFLGASKYHWLGYSTDKLKESYRNALAVQRGIELHSFAKRCIELKQKLADNPKTTLSSYVNESIDYDMKPEVVLYYSENCFGTADAIKYNENNQTLYIFDLKTGKTPAHIEQLKIYAALFCFEYNFDPNDILFELRIYQSPEPFIFRPDSPDIRLIMDKIIVADSIINKLRKEEN